MDGGEARVVTALPLGAGVPVWSPDSTRIAVTARFPEPGRYGSTAPGSDRRPAPNAEAPRLVTRLDFHVDGSGYLLDKPQQLVVVDVTDRHAPLVDTALTSAPCSLDTPVWYPDGSALLVVAPVTSASARPTTTTSTASTSPTARSSSRSAPRAASGPSPCRTTASSTTSGRRTPTVRSSPSPRASGARPTARIRSG
ncbi:hypothetical protein P9139_09220 [Curtobacterium flaccumfaciens]|nr:hypothetical protein P9139_09220 [Curtobacterium flaccumfaciens]